MIKILQLFYDKNIMFVRKSSSHRRCSVRKSVLINYTKFRRKHLCQSLRPATILKKRGWCSCFRVIFAKFLRTTFLQNTSGRLLLNLSLRCWFSEAAVLKNFAILRPLSDNKVADLRLTPTLATSEFLLQQFFFFFFAAEDGTYFWQLQRFLFWTPLKIWDKPQKSPQKLFCKKVY